MEQHYQGQNTTPNSLYQDTSDVHGNFNGMRIFTPNTQEQMDSTLQNPEYTTPFQETTEEFENLQNPQIPITPSTASNFLLANISTPHQSPDLNMQARTLFTDSPLISQSVDVTRTKSSQVCGEHIVNLTVQPTCGSALEHDETSTSNDGPICTFQTKAAKMIQKVTWHTKVLSEFDFLRAKLKLKKAKKTSL